MDDVTDEEEEEDDDVNAPIYDLDPSHPALRFLEAFLDCRSDCLAREIDFGNNVPIDQEWISSYDQRRWTFSGFAYMMIAIRFRLDGILDHVPHLIGFEISFSERLPLMRHLMAECESAAKACDNQPILELVEEVCQMLDRWEEYIRFREAAIASGNP